MKYFTQVTRLLLPLLAISPTSTLALWRGFNLGGLPSGACKSQANWQYEFGLLQSFPGNFSAVRLYASSDCQTLQYAVPAALATGIKLLVGIWTEDGYHFGNEKGSFLTAMRTWGVGWIAAVSVGSEDLYRKDTNSTTLAQQIYDVRGMISTIPNSKGVLVGHVDTWNAWVDPANQPAIMACDFIGTDAYPYWQSVAESQANATFWTAIKNVENWVKQVKPGLPVWITETGTAVTGPTRGPAIPGVTSLQDYWNKVACSAMSNYNVFWYTLQDYSSTPSFGVVDANYKPLITFNC